ncbi:PAS domain-containing protein [Altererythrobacter sp. MTPC7]|uniref:PAS domain-containing protein n=1 Tax=Altererythrobacter sp. MTPC7 TaxID=3056567 RepID=UPI0036F1BA7C
MADNNEPEDQRAYERLPFSLTIANLSLEDEPLVYVNRAFEQMTGYSSASVLGRNCRFLQGEKTDQEKVRQLSRAIHKREEIETSIYNYRANGEGFWNRLVMGPLEEKEGETSDFYVGIQYDMGSDISPTPSETVENQLAEVQHRVKNHLSMVISMIRLQARKPVKTEADFDSLSRRVEALQLLYQEMDAGGAGRASEKTIALGAYLTRISSAINHLDGRPGVKANFEADTIKVETETAARIGLIVSEILTNSLQHAFKGRDEGTLISRAILLSEDRLRISIEDDGVGIPDDCNWPHEGNLGARIVTTLVAGLQGELNVIRGSTGTIIHLDIPLAKQAAQIEDERAKG